MKVPANVLQNLKCVTQKNVTLKLSCSMYNLHLAMPYAVIMAWVLLIMFLIQRLCIPVTAVVPDLS